MDTSIQAERVAHTKLMAQVGESLLERIAARVEQRTIDAVQPHIQAVKELLRTAGYMYGGVSLEDQFKRSAALSGELDALGHKIEDEIRARIAHGEVKRALDCIVRMPEDTACGGAEEEGDCLRWLTEDCVTSQPIKHKTPAK